MPTPSKYAHLKDTWVALYENGESFRSIGRKYDVSKATVQRMIGDVIEKRPRSAYDIHREVWTHLYERGDSSVVIGRKYDVEPSIVLGRLKAWGVPFRSDQNPMYQYGLEERPFIAYVETWKQQYESGMSLREIADATPESVSIQTISNYLKEHQTQLRSYEETSRLYDVDINYFDVIDSPMKAYVLGIVFSNGCLVRGLSSLNVRITMRKPKRDFLELLQKELHTNRPIAETVDRRFDVPVLSLTVQNMHMFETLERIGLSDSKSEGLRFPDGFSDELSDFFVLGYFSARLSLSHSDIVIRGTESFLSALEAHLFRQSGAIGLLRPVGNGRFELLYSTNDSVARIKDFLNQTKQRLDAL